MRGEEGERVHSPLRSLARQYFDGQLDWQAYREQRRRLISELEDRSLTANSVNDPIGARQPDAGNAVAAFAGADAAEPLAADSRSGSLSDTAAQVSADDLVSALADRAPESVPGSANSAPSAISDPTSDAILQQLSSAQEAADKEAAEHKKRRGRRIRVFILSVLLLLAGGLYVSMELGLLTL